jgi:hypothetical protein
LMSVWSPPGWCGHFFYMGTMCQNQTWALTLFSRFALRSFFIHGSLSVILTIFRFAHRSIALKKIRSLLLEKAAAAQDYTSPNQTG